MICLVCDYATSDIRAGKFTENEFLKAFYEAGKYYSNMPKYSEILKVLGDIREQNRYKKVEKIAEKFQVESDNTQHEPLTEEEKKKLKEFGFWKFIEKKIK